MTWSAHTSHRSLRTGSTPTIRWLLVAGTVLVVAATASATPPYARTGWLASIPTGFHGVQGKVTILDATTLQVDHFTYDGTAPAVYFYLGQENQNIAFQNGLAVPPELDSHFYSNESFPLLLPPGTNLDGYNAVSVWCQDFSVNFSSATFEPPVYGDLDCSGSVDFFDIDPFVLALTSYEGYDAAYPACNFFNADCNHDGSVDFFDIDPFVTLLASP